MPRLEAIIALFCAIVLSFEASNMTTTLPRRERERERPQTTRPVVLRQQTIQRWVF